MNIIYNYSILFLYFVVAVTWKKPLSETSETGKLLPGSYGVKLMYIAMSYGYI